MFDTTDGVHLCHYYASFALQLRANTLLNFYCNAYDVAAADELRCCAEHERRPWEHSPSFCRRFAHNFFLSYHGLDFG